MIGKIEVSKTKKTETDKSVNPIPNFLVIIGLKNIDLKDTSP